MLLADNICNCSEQEYDPTVLVSSLTSVVVQASISGEDQIECVLIVFEHGMFRFWEPGSFIRIVLRGGLQ